MREFSAQMAEKIVDIANLEIIRRIKKIVADKKHIHEKIREGKVGNSEGIDHFIS
ncbi:hypothetical protein [Chryseolinea serpens]|uniref:hypothetical protein n=1 Tax=Chryseolinea serpens TaxID=947013 RepID=UPI0015C04460|nr:hypothetical protein [Chryseolinea serpens]